LAKIKHAIWFGLTLSIASWRKHEFTRTVILTFAHS
jgi:hypothetical protein